MPTTRRVFLKCLAGLGAGSLLSWIFLPKKAVSGSVSRAEQEWAIDQEAELSFVVISDIHINRFNALKHFSALLKDNYNSGLDAMVVVGDLGDGRLFDYAKIDNELARHKSEIDYPIYWTIGNHDFYGGFYKYRFWSRPTFPNRETDAIAINRFLRLAKRSKVYGDTWIGGYHFVFLGSEKSRMSELQYSDLAYLSDTQLDWLQDALNNNKRPHKPIFVFLHQPIPYTTLGGLQQGYVIQWQKLKAILEQHREVILFNGHTHYKIDYNNMVSKADFTIVNSSSLAYPIERNRIPIMNSAPGLVVKVYNNKVVIRGRDFWKRDWIRAAEITVSE